MSRRQVLQGMSVKPFRQILEELTVQQSRINVKQDSNDESRLYTETEYSRIFAFSPQKGGNFFTPLLALNVCTRVL